MAQEVKKVQPAKLEAAAKLKEQVTAKPDIIFSDFRGLTFPQMTELRAKLGEKDASYRVVRNSVARVAIKEAGLPDASGLLEGPTALAFLGRDPGAAAKIMLDFARGAPLQLKGGVIGGRMFAVKEIEALSRLPGRDQLIAMLMSTMNAPVRNMMNVMNGVTSKLVRTLAAVGEKKASAAPDAAEAKA
jgi:large subunit ribosomal protein L10